MTVVAQKALKGMPKKFNLKTLNEKEQIAIKELEKEIQTALKYKDKNVFKIGKLLIALKEKLPYGQFAVWVESALHISYATVERYMKATKHFEGRYAQFEHLSLAALAELTRPSVPDSYIAAIASGKIIPTVDDVREEIKSLRSQPAQIKEIEAISPESQEKIKSLQSRLETLQATHQEALQANRALSQQNEKLNRKLEKLQNLIQYFAGEYSHINEGDTNHAHQ